MSGGSPGGVWLVDKPEGPTSHDVIAEIRRRLGRTIKVGHAGTLDPFATGLLLVLVGRATRLSRYLIGLDKSYVADVVLGQRSASGDPEGPVTPGGEVPDHAAIERVVAELPGSREQQVPALSAVRVDGERLYRRTRRGDVDIERPRRAITITAAKLLEISADRRLVNVELTVSKGTYIRQVAVDMGEELGCGGYCGALRRTSIGELTLDGSVEPGEVSALGGLRPHEALPHLPRQELTEAEAKRMSHGMPLEGGDVGPAVLTHRDRTIAIARGDGAVLRAEVVFA